MTCLLVLGLLIAAGRAEVREHFQDIIHTVNAGPAKWKAGYNFDPSPALLQSGRTLETLRYSYHPPPRQASNAADVPIPEEFDARTRWPFCPTIGQILEQGGCLSDWAIAATSAFSDRLCIATNGTFNLPLSAQELVSCCTNCGFGCGGGYQGLAWKYFQEHGVVTGGAYNSSVGCQPYESHSNSSVPVHLTFPEPGTPSCQRNCTNPSYGVAYANDHHKVKNVYSIFQDVAQIQKDIMLHGPVESTFDIYEDFLTYKSGIYHHVTGLILAQPTRAVKVIGWGVDNGTAYWLAANSWGESWGDKGLFKILRGVNECGFEDQVVAGIPDV